MGYFLDNWGNFVGVAGAIVSLAGLVVSYVAMRRAGKARDAAAAAEVASNETQVEITKVLAIVDLERAIGLIERLKAFHRNSQTEVEPIIWTGSGRSYVRIPALLPVIRSPLPVNPSFH